ncbi:regulator of G-protein signaling 12-like [Limulus polyphemus]|uniref:Regulator of G-protein signaling 12-like n=1 Tax=Limulus polyphemus TaxID=6850 RepID=A0ABM1BL83_LIMPO|nr:regulator of G-protein signaling 12-like [Limulus polyphemus]
MDRCQREFNDEQSPLGIFSREPCGPMRQKPERLIQKSGGNSIMEIVDSAWEESSPSWASSSTGNTPSYGSAGLAFEFGQKCNINTDYYTPEPTERPTASYQRKNEEVERRGSLSSDQLAEFDSQESGSDTPNDWICGVRAKVRKGSTDNYKHPGGTSMTASISKGTERISRLLRRTHSAGCSKDVPAHALFLREKPMVSEKEIDDKEVIVIGDSLTRAQDMKLKLGFLRRRHTESSIQSTVRPSPEEAEKWTESFHELMASKYGSALFRAFLSREFSEENIEFWLACEDFKKTKTNKLPSKARKIYNDFIAVQAPKEVNLDSTTRTTIMNSLSKPDHHSFDQAQRKVQGLMERDAYLRFFQSELYLELLQGSG